jgi:hypothetical protein
VEFAASQLFLHRSTSSSSNRAVVTCALLLAISPDFHPTNFLLPAEFSTTLNSHYAVSIHLSRHSPTYAVVRFGRDRPKTLKTVIQVPTDQIILVLQFYHCNNCATCGIPNSKIRRTNIYIHIYIMLPSFKYCMIAR